VKSLEELNKIKKETLEKVNLRQGKGDIKIIVGMDTCGISAGARQVMKAILDELDKRNLKDVLVTQTECIGMCRFEPIVEVCVPGEEKVTYIEMTPEKVRRMVAEHIIDGNVIEEYTLRSHKER
jgi:NADP-reducing hydrogenase subunit HndB